MLVLPSSTWYFFVFSRSFNVKEKDIVAVKELHHKHTPAQWMIYVFMYPSYMLKFSWKPTNYSLIWTISPCELKTFCVFEFSALRGSNKWGHITFSDHYWKSHFFVEKNDKHWKVEIDPFGGVGWGNRSKTCV